MLIDPFTTAYNVNPNKLVSLQNSEFTSKNDELLFIFGLVRFVGIE